MTGPTGSGKSTTLYAALDQLIKRDLSVVRVEETVEFHILGAGQRAYRTDFPAGAAQYTVQSSLTGHLVLSTLHTNSA